MNRRGFVGTLAVVVLAPFVKAPPVSPVLTEDELKFLRWWSSEATHQPALAVYQLRHRESCVVWDSKTGCNALNIPVLYK